MTCIACMYCMMVGINCRFGMRGVAAAAHYDGKRNFIAMLRGRKRSCEADRLSHYTSTPILFLVHSSVYPQLPPHVPIDTSSSLLVSAGA